MSKKNNIESVFKEIQDDICNHLTALDGHSHFEEDQWSRPGGGGGRTRIMSDGDLIEKGGVNFSAVHGELPDPIKNQLQVAGETFFASGVSIVLHPKNPFVPIIHMNIRYFEIDENSYWFGGGIDLTPAYVESQMGGVFHRDLKNICDEFNPEAYSTYKKWADDYFFIKHRNETRGIGGIFFDKLKEDKTTTKEEVFEFVKSVGFGFYPLYEKQAQYFRSKSYDENHLKWQNIRRGRYVEFNLVYDKGTTFGLQTNGRTESILMSLPKTAGWEYNHHPEIDSPEEKSLRYFKKEIDWVNK